MKKIIVFLLCIVYCALCIEVVAQTRRDGETHFNAKRYEEAYNVYANLMSRYTKDYTLKYQTARCLYELGRKEEAFKLFKLAGDNGVVKANIFLFEIYFEEYRFDEASAALSAYIETLGEEQDSLLEVYNQKLQKANLGVSMLDRVEDVAIIDSIKVHKSQILSAYRLPRDLGKLDQYKKIFGKETEQTQLVYYTGRGDKMIFSNETNDAQLDLNVSYRLVGGWSEASNLSSVLNTSADENYPFELPDGVTLYFASKGHNSLGGYDIFLTRYNSTIEDYSTPVNIGMPFNSPANDYFYVFDEMAHIGWFATDRFQPEDTVVVYEFVPNKEKLLIKTDDIEYKRRAAQLKIYRKANVTVAKQEDKTTKEESDESDFKFMINDGIVYTRITQFVSEVAKNIFLQTQDLNKQLNALKLSLEDKRREYFFSTKEEEKNILKEDILKLEKELRKSKNLLDQFIFQIRTEEIKALNDKD